VWEDNSVRDRSSTASGRPRPSGPSASRSGDLGQGGGWIRGYEATTGKKLWSYTNPRIPSGRKRATRSFPRRSSTRIAYASATGRIRNTARASGTSNAIDATKRGDITETGRIFHFDKIRRSISTPSIADGLIYIPDFSGFFHCLDAETGREYWVHDLTAAVWGSALVADGKIYLGTEDGDVLIMQAGKEKKVLGTFNMGTAVYGTAVPAHNTLFIMNRNQLYALAAK
jgi:outer membrane protein assembly factor BamB